MKYLLDTNICIYLIREQPYEVLETFQAHEVGDIGISSITLAELAYGIEKSQYPHRNAQALQRFLVPLEIASFDAAAAMAYGQIRAYLEHQGTPIGSLDTLIAAHALGLDAILVTNNIREFSRVPDLRVENWVADRP